MPNLPAIIDTFTDVAGTQAVKHAAEFGGPLSDVLGNSNAVITAANRMRANQLGGSILQYAASSIWPDGVIEASLYCASAVGLSSYLLRRTPAGPGYLLYWSAGFWTLQGGALNLSVAQALNPGQRYKVKFSAIGSIITAAVDGTQILQGTDTAIVAAGSFAWGLSGGGTDATGLQLDDFLAYWIPGATPPLPPTLTGGSLPLVERIRQNILQVIGGISVEAGYQCNVFATEPDRLGEVGTDGITVVADVELGGAQWDRSLQCNSIMCWVQEFEIIASCSQPEAGPGGTPPIPADQLVLIARSDIEKALQLDPHRGGLAANTLPAPPSWFEREAGDHEGVIARVYVEYRTNWNDPYSFRA